MNDKLEAFRRELESWREMRWGITFEILGGVQIVVPEPSQSGTTF